MSQRIWKWSPSQHEVAVIFGSDAVDAYEEGETSVEALKRLGLVKFYEFDSIPELNAFIMGIEEAQTGMEGLPVDDLTQ
ncbi:hypothetical protein MHM88_14705 [Epibacterium sp. MM17-32]|uniref:hypothetical protein n=1 Tax=Epibacterium sp. MM17-32 TaxID=2917734 RepID=UPI001EF42807|nr:hypothetical protein [Epibacterium sp. MM17-32]MCG7629059.1 hypothetical protein [Epibacterium sp. MM17-32]